MLVTFILGLAAGAGAPHAEPHLKAALSGALPPGRPMGATELRLFSFAACLVVAAVLSAIFGSGSAVALTLGAALGVSGPRLMDRVTRRSSPDYGPDPD